MAIKKSSSDEEKEDASQCFSSDKKEEMHPKLLKQEDQLEFEAMSS